jgi:CheY-like chemotaxis protein
MSLPVALVVEDDADSRALFCDCLEMGGFHTLNAASADEALAVLGHHTPHLVLCDVNMPGKSGLAVLEHLRDQPRFNLTKKVVITANPLAEDAAEAIGVDLFLVKPISVREMLQLVRRLVALDT